MAQTKKLCVINRLKGKTWQQQKQLKGYLTVQPETYITTLWNIIS